MRVVIATNDTNPSHAGFIRLDATKITKVGCLVHLCPTLFVWSRLSSVLSCLETVLASRLECGPWEATHPQAEEDSRDFASRRPSPLAGDPSSPLLSCT